MMVYGVIRKISDALGISNSFALANICAFALSGSAVGFSIAVLTGIVAWRSEAFAKRAGHASSGLHEIENEAFQAIQPLILGRGANAGNLGLRINSIGVGIAAILTGLFTSMSGHFEAALFPVLAGLSFAIGNFFGSSAKAQDIQAGRVQASGVARVFTNPAVYYGVGYINLGLLAGGGVMLFRHPLDNAAALVTTLLSIASTTLSVIGLLTKQIKNPAPFTFVAHGTAFNVLSGLLTLNPLAMLNNAFACHGEVKLGLLLREENAPARNGFFGRVSYIVSWPVRLIDRLSV